MKKILLYECEGVIALELRTLLKGYEISSTNSLLIIPDLIDNGGYSLLIIDCVDIEQTLFVIKKMRTTSDCPIILLSPYPERMTEQFKQYGCSLILLPFDSKTLVETVKKLIG